VVTVEILSTVSSAISIAKKLREVSEKTRDAESKLLVADLTVKLADIKMQLAEMMDENRELKEKVRSLESTEREQCPKCRKRTWELVKSSPDPTFGQAGMIRRIYKCSECHFSEEKVIAPGS
jgi:DNA-directed RNA polymerase subunit RPC12/RpoP